MGHEINYMFNETKNHLSRRDYLRNKNLMYWGFKVYRYIKKYKNSL